MTPEEQAASEAAEVNRVSNFILSVLCLYDELVPELRTDLGMQLMSSHVLRIAGHEGPTE